MKREQPVIENHFDANELNSHDNDNSTNLVNTRPQIFDTHGYQLPVVHARQVFIYISNLTKKKAVGPDGLPYWLYRENAHNIAEFLTLFLVPLYQVRFFLKLGKLVYKAHSDVPPSI